MKKVLFLVFAFVFVSCQKKIEFASEVDHLDYCMQAQNIDNSNCDFYRPLVVKFWLKASDFYNRPLPDRYLSTKSFSVYSHSKDFFSDLKKLNKNCNTYLDVRCEAIRDYFKKN